MNNIIATISNYICIVIIFLSTTSLTGEESEKEVLNYGDQVCFVLNVDGEPVLLGSSMWAKEAVEDGREMFYSRYFYEGISLTDENGEELHIYGPILEETGKEWASMMSTMSFNDYVQAKQKWDAEFAEKIEGENVRYFSDEERDQTQVHWIDGALWQIGLDKEQKELTQVPAGVYAFVLSDEHLYITPKIVTEKGKIQHSSFLRGGPVRSAGKMQVGEDGRIVWLSNDSGHYRPEDLEVIEVLRFIHNQMPKSFKQIWIRIKPSEAWNVPPSELKIDYDANEIDHENDVPVTQWIEELKESE